MLTLLDSERPKLYAILAFLSAIGLIWKKNKKTKQKKKQQKKKNNRKLSKMSGALVNNKVWTNDANIS